MKKIFNSALICATLLFFTSLSVNAQTSTYQSMSINSTINSSTRIDSFAVIEITGCEAGEDIIVTIERTEFDNGPIAHYRADIVNTGAFLYPLEPSNTFTGIISGRLVNDRITLSIIDLERRSSVNPGYPGQAFKITVRQLNYDVILSEDFESGMNGWETYKHWSAEAYFKLENWGSNTVLNTSILNHGSETWHVHIRKTGIPIVEGKLYKVMFKARTEDVGIMKPFSVRIEEDGGDYTAYAEDKNYAYGHMNSYSFQFTATQSNPNAVICFELGQFFNREDPLDFIVDDIQINEYTE